MQNTLYLVPTPISPIGEFLLPDQLQAIKHIKHWIVETPKTARQRLKRIPLETTLQELDLTQFDKKTHDKHIDFTLEYLYQGNDVAFMSDAGLPAIADPGYRLVRRAHEQGYQVKSLVGPSSIHLALSSSGLPGDKYTFHGYIPVDADKRSSFIKRMGQDAFDTGYTQIFLETPYRNNAVLKSLIKSLHPQIRLTVAINLMMKDESVSTFTVGEWGSLKTSDLDEKYCVFLIGK